MNEETQYVERLLTEFETLPRFPDGRIDYAASPKAPVVTCFVRHAGKILLLRRSAKVRTYQGKWCTVAGYIDEVKPVHEKAMTELTEELGIDRKEMIDSRQGVPYEFLDPERQRTWVVHPVLVEIRAEPLIRLDWEHTEFRWILPDTIGEYDTVPMLERSLKTVMGG